MKYIYAIISVILLIACSNEIDEVCDSTTNGKVDKIIIKSQPFEFEDDTRTSLSATDKKISFAWADYDVIGVFPVSPTTNNQAKQKLKIPADCETDAHYASFDGAGWELKTGQKYAAYSPYNGGLSSETPYTAVPIDLSSQTGKLNAIGQWYDYMYAPSTSRKEICTNGIHEVVFDFKHIVSIIQLKLTMPVAANWENIIVKNSAGDKVWAITGTFNVSNGVVTPKETTSSLRINLDNTSSKENEEITLYLSVLPTTTGELNLTALTKDGRRYGTTFATRTLIAGKAYRYSATLSKSPDTGTENGYTWVELGLPSGLKWAATNIGASTPTDYGNYFAWGEIEQQANNRYYWDSYKHCNGTYYSITKYGAYPSYGVTDNYKTLFAEDDAACQKWKGKWRMPTREEFEELLFYCTVKSVTSYDGVEINGITIEARNGNVIFLPTAGYYKEGENSSTNRYAFYWTSTLFNIRSSDSAYYFDYESGSLGIESTERYRGMSVRAVCE